MRGGGVSVSLCSLLRRLHSLFSLHDSPSVGPFLFNTPADADASGGVLPADADASSGAWPADADASGSSSAASTDA